MAHFPVASLTKVKTFPPDIHLCWFYYLYRSQNTNVTFSWERLICLIERGKISQTKKITPVKHISSDKTTRAIYSGASYYKHQTFFI